VAEALLTGIPVVTRNNSSLPEVLGPGGYATGPDDAEAALAMLRILQNQDLGSQLGDAGRAHARSFLPDRFLDRVLLGYESAFQPDGPTGDKVRQDGATAHSDDCNGSAPAISRSQLRQALGVQPHAHLVVVGGGAHPGNRTDVLASVLEILTRRHAGLVLALTGPCDRDEVQRLFAWASARCLRHALVVTGPVSPAVEQQWFQAADVLVPPPPARDGAIQGFLDRARATGTAPILGRQDRDSSNSPSTDWTFAPGPDESVQLAAAIEHLLKNPADAESLIHHQSTANS
jgi:glycosyltransferase involved in cell wall biosynthesis